MPRLINALIVASMAAGVVLAFVGSHTLRWSPPPAPPRWEELSGGPPAPAGPQHKPGARSPWQQGGTAPARDGYQPTPMAVSVPVAVTIPGIRVRARVIALGLARGGAVEVPPLTRPFLTSWYDRGPTPGAPGAAVLFGHVDSAAVGPAVFYRLGELRPGDLIYVTLQDRRTGMFRVYSAALYPKADFPARAIYGYTSWPSLRLITCGGKFDTTSGHYLGSTVVFAQYVGQRAGAASP